MVQVRPHSSKAVTSTTVSVTGHIWQVKRDIERPLNNIKIAIKGWDFGLNLFLCENQHLAIQPHYKK